MKRTIQYFFMLFAAAVIFAACEDWLDVTSPSEVREDEQFSTAAGFEQALIGCYITMSSEALYGKYLSWHLPELLARQFRLITNPLGDVTFQAYNYETPLVRAAIDRIWRTGYNVIANANNALAFINSRGEEVLHPIQYKLIKGELLAIRAYMHFDLLRVFGYGNWERRPEMTEKYTLPYVTTVSKSISPQLKGKEYLQAVLNDLNEALVLLGDIDPVLKQHDEAFYAEVNLDGFFNNRTKRLNYYAVKALMARVYSWEGSNQSKILARDIAMETIAGLRQNNVVQWMTQTEISANRACTNEAIFMINVKDLMTSTAEYIKLGLSTLDATQSAFMYITAALADDLYEINTVGYADWRYTGLTYFGSHANGSYRVPLKMYQDNNMNLYYKDLIPLLRLPELYYIAAEIYITGPNPDLSKAKELLEEVRASRSVIIPLTAVTAEEFKAELLKEYKKEFLSEGVMFFYYKRTGMEQIPQYTKEMGDAQYVLPFPDIEIANGRVQ